MVHTKSPANLWQLKNNKELSASTGADKAQAALGVVLWCSKNSLQKIRGFNFSQKQIPNKSENAHSRERHPP